MGNIKNNCIKCGADLTDNILDCHVREGRSICKQCSRNKNKKLYILNGERKRTKDRKRYANDLEFRLRKAKQRAKDRGLGFIPMFPNPFAYNVEIDWHHVNDVYVVAIPRELHALYLHHKYHVLPTNMK